MPSDREKLQGWLENLPPGPIVNDATLTDLLSAAWGQLHGSSAESTRAEKLPGRIEQPVWNPPFVTFVIERHGGTVAGSSRAELHRWRINVRAGIAECDPHHGHRQLKKMATRLDMKKLAMEIAAAIQRGDNDERLKWAADKHQVEILVGIFIGGVEQTRTARRKRFHAALEDILAHAGWEHVARTAKYRRI